METGRGTTTGATGIIGRAPLPSESNTPSGLPFNPGMEGPEGPTGGPSSLAAGMSTGTRVDGLRKMVALLDGVAFVPVCVLVAGAAAKGCPILTGVDSWRNKGRPV